MQLGHTQRRLLSRSGCILRSYSVRIVPGNTSSETAVPPRPRRPLASNFRGIDIENIHSASQKPRIRTNGPPRSDGPSDARRKGQPERRGTAKGGAPSMSGWSDGLVSLKFSSRLKQLHEKKTTHSHGPRSDAQSRKEHPKPAYRPQMHGRQYVQREQGDASHAPHHAERNKSPTRQRTRAPATTDGQPKSKATSMTRPSYTSTFKLHAQQSTTKSATTTTASPTVVSEKTKAGTPVPPLTTAGQTTSTSTARRNPRLTTALTSTNLNALFRTRDAPIAGIVLPAHASMSTRVRSVLERRAGDHSRFLPPRVGVRKDTSRLPALRAARHALSAQRDVSLDQRRLVLHIIEGLVQPQG